MSPGFVRVAAVQLTSGSSPSSNLEAAIRLIRVAAVQGAEYIQLPEYFSYLGPESDYARVAETIPGPTTKTIAELARELRVVIHVGSMLERSNEASRCYNTSVVIGRDGAILATYRKGHLFDINVPGEVEYQESASIAPGDQLVVVPLEHFALGLSICFDVRFAELYRRLAINGASVFAVPAAFAVPTGRAHWEVLLRARAIENHAFVVAAAQAGTTEEGISSYGHSLIVNPWGEVIAESTIDKEDLIIATLDLGEVARRRQHIGVLELRRPDLYESLADPRMRS